MLLVRGHYFFLFLFVCLHCGDNQTIDISICKKKKKIYIYILGENLMITGRNGSGKSSILRALSGIWRVSDGKIHISPLLHSANDLYFLPQRSYLVPGLSVRQQLSYPNIQVGAAAYEKKSELEKDAPNGHGGNSNSPLKNGHRVSSNAIERKELGDITSDEDIIELLNLCDLGRLPLYYGLNSPVDTMFWHQLSPGEQQLIGLCRVLLRKPKIAFLDECCSAVSADKKHWFYQACSQREITLVSVAHDTSIQKYHKNHLQYKHVPIKIFTLIINYVYDKRVCQLIWMKLLFMQFHHLFLDPLSFIFFNPNFFKAIPSVYETRFILRN
ncbi:ATP-binding cassette superfamily [Reticulomyxa filosa]|uniref:ATP-binding cassette superfamily n=1 Tax=Reticulomyxa filosa TaxID=46433 RepID=X6PDU5_RETFI|nr:ATP-binding cassette superfamily [Reticulomyxa filosa]|eukprot:ETO36680.1 ATP-binding cassette superfamily [Reticulomyxa filosa]